MLLAFLNSKPLGQPKFTINAILNKMFGTDFAKIHPVTKENHLAEFAAHSFLMGVAGAQIFTGSGRNHFQIV
jgi:hypothetical protein